MASLCLVIPYFIQPRGSQIQISHTEDLFKPRGLDVLGLNPRICISNKFPGIKDATQSTKIPFPGTLVASEFVSTNSTVLKIGQKKSWHTVTFLKDKFLEVRLLRLRVSQV